MSDFTKVLKTVIEATEIAKVHIKAEVDPDERNSIGTIEEMHVIDADMFTHMLTQALKDDAGEEGE